MAPMGSKSLLLRARRVKYMNTNPTCPLVHVFDTQVAPRVTQAMPLSCLKGSVIGIDATYYLEKLLTAHKEPLLSALGGFPLSLETRIVQELGDIQAFGIKPYFVFNGLDWGIKDDPFAASIASARANANGFDIYERDQAKDAIDIFRNSGHHHSFDLLKHRFRLLTSRSGTPTPTNLVPFLKKVLHENEYPFIVAPFSSLAQVTTFRSRCNVPN